MGSAELMEQTMEQSIVPDYIFHATALFAEKEILGQMLSEFETRLKRQGIRRISLMTSRGKRTVSVTGGVMTGENRGIGSGNSSAADTSVL